MKAIVLESPGNFRLGESPELSARDVPPGYAQVRVHRVGICGTDWHAFHGRQPFFAYPRILGHELGVEIEGVNDPSSDLAVGDRCCVEPYLNCGKCIACRNGKGNCCADLKVMGVHVDGGMRDRILVPAKKLHRSRKLDWDQLALVETLGIGCHAVQRAEPREGENLLIVGAGPIGLSIIPFAMECKANVIVADVSASRLEFCQRQMRVPHVVDAAGDLGGDIKKLLGGDLPTLVMDATGNPGSMARCFQLVAHGGKIVFVGLFSGDLSFNDPDFHRRELTIRASRNSLPADFASIIQGIELGRIDTRPWITHRSPASEFLDVLPSWLSPQAGVLKAILEF
jgi:2-desacetyl-2-hydroxyethyl bacteriochlorophyllide A dehydrogenase